MATFVIELTNAQAVAARKISMLAKRGATKNLGAEEYVGRLVNQQLTTKYEAIHKTLAEAETKAYESAKEMLAKCGTEMPITLKEHLANRLEESKDILEALKNGGSLDE